MNSQQEHKCLDIDVEKGGKVKEEEKKKLIITVSPFPSSQEQNTGSTREKKVKGQHHTFENQNQTEQIWRTIHWQCVLEELCTKCKPDESRQMCKEVGKNRQNPKGNTKERGSHTPSRDQTPSAATTRTGFEFILVQVAQTPSKDQTPTAATASTGVKLLVVEVKAASPKKLAATTAAENTGDQPVVRTPSTDQTSTAATASTDVEFIFVEVEQAPPKDETSTPATASTGRKKQKSSEDKTNNKQEQECLLFRMKTSFTPPTLILYLLGNSEKFCSGNNRKKEEFERHFLNCVLDTPTWVFASSELEEYLGNLRQKYSFKENQSIFFFHTTDITYNVVFSALKYISEKTEASLVFLFLNGGKDAFLATVPVALEEKIPVVAIKGSGNFADDLPQKKRRESKDTTKKSSEDNQHRHNDTVPKRVTTQSSKESKATSERSNEDNGETAQSAQVDKSVADTKFIEYDLVSNFGRQNALRLSLLDAIFTEDDDQESDDKNVKTDTSGKQEHKLTRLALAHAWGCFEKAKEMRWSKFESDKLHPLMEMMEKALVQEQVEFVELFLDLGVDLKAFLTDDRLLSLCREEYVEKDSMFKKLSKDVDWTEEYVEKDSMFKKLSKDVDWTEVTENQSESAHKRLSRVLTDLLDDIWIKVLRGFYDQKRLPLFLWALLSKKFNLAKFLWRDVQDHVTTALVACSLLRAMRSRTMNDVRFDDEQQEITTTIELFEGLAIKTLNNCYKEDQTRTFQLLSRIQETEYWRGVTCLEIAEQARCRKFIAQEPCQNFADRIWRGIDPYLKNEEDKTDQFLVITRFFYAISAIFVIVPKMFMDFSQNKRGPSQLRYAFSRFCFYWPRYWEDPSFKFYAGWFFFMGFLLLYTYVLMVRIPPADVHISEVALFIWFGTMYFEELRVGLELVRPKRQRVKVFLLSQLGFLNVTNYYLAWGGIIQWLLFDSSAISLHLVLCINFISFICRLFYFLSINSQLGPKVFMIYQMIKEIILFSVLLIIIFLTYGVIVYSIENRGHGVVNSTVVLSLPVEAFWLMLADRPQDVDENDDDPKVVFRGLLRVAYLFFTSLLLINVLIAAFSNLYENINNQKDDVRKYQKFHMIVKFYLGSPLPPPLTLFYYPILYIFRCCGYDITKNKAHTGKNHDGNKNWQENRFRLFLSESDTTILLNWAKFTTETYTEEKPKTVEDLVKETMENNFSNEDKKTVTKEYCDTYRNSSEDEYGELTDDLLELHDCILDSTSTLNKAMTSVEERIACHPCIIYKSCVLCGKPPGNPTYLSGRHRNVGIQGESSLRRKSMPNLMKMPAPEC